MGNLTENVTKRRLQFKVAQQCLSSLSDPIDIFKTALGVGATLGCIAGVMGPQALIAGGLCAAVFTGVQINDKRNEKIKLSHITECRSAGAAVCSDEEYQRQVGELKSATDALNFTILLLPLEFTGIGKGIKKGIQAFKGTTREATLLNRAVNKEANRILQIDNPNIRAQKMDELKEKVIKTPESLFEPKILDEISDMSGAIKTTHLKRLPTAYKQKLDDITERLKRLNISSEEKKFNSSPTKKNLKEPNCY